MDTIIFGLLLMAGLIIVFSPKRWLVITSWAVAFAMVIFLFDHHVTSVLPWSF